MEASQTSAIAINPQALAVARDAMSDEDVLADVAAFRELTDPTRARILYALTQGPLCVHDLTALARQHLISQNIQHYSPSQALLHVADRHANRPNEPSSGMMAYVCVARAPAGLGVCTGIGITEEPSGGTQQPAGPSIVGATLAGSG
jgi:hypothetical protein